MLEETTLKLLEFIKIQKMNNNKLTNLYQKTKHHNKF